ncbi:unnamed protein product, partial [Mesorhabditis spiculigera]
MLKLFLGFSLIGLFVAFDLNLCDTKKTIQCELWETCCPGKGGTYACCPYLKGNCCGLDSDRCCPPGFNCGPAGCQRIPHNGTAL